LGTKPSDWIDNEMIADPERFHPPPEWLLDEPKFITDPNALKSAFSTLCADNPNMAAVFCGIVALIPIVVIALSCCRKPKAAEAARTKDDDAPMDDTKEETEETEPIKKEEEVLAAKEEASPTAEATCRAPNNRKANNGDE
jgi:hypothetical protein